MKQDNVIHKHIQDKQDSIEVNQNAKGEYSFHVKVYYNSDNGNSETVIKKINGIYAKLQKKFKWSLFKNSETLTFILQYIISRV